MRMRLSRDERRLRLLLAAIEVFGEKGYRKTEVSEIVHRAGVTKPMLYRHFPGGKAEIYMEVLDDHLQSMMRKLGEAMAKAEAPLDAMDPRDTPGTRASVDRCEIKAEFSSG